MLSVKSNIGALDRKITFQEKVYAVDESNQKTIVGWQDIPTTPTVYAQVDEHSGAEVIQGQQLTGLKTSTFTIRYRNDITIENRILYNGGKYDLHVIVEVARKRYLKCISESGGHYSESDFTDIES